MIIRLFILQKEATVNPQNKVILGALHQLGFKGMKELQIGRYLELEVDGSLSPEEWKSGLNKTFQKASCAEFPNPVMEDYRIEITQ